MSVSLDIIVKDETSGIFRRLNEKVIYLQGSNGTSYYNKFLNLYGDRDEKIIPEKDLQFIEDVSELYQDLDALAKDLGSPLRAPFMTLSFLALLVIPELKLSDQGLFDGNAFSFCDLFVDAKS